MRLAALSGWFDAESIIHGMAQSLLTAQVFFRRLHGYMTEQKLNLFKLASRIVTEPRTRPSEIVRREL
jgi:hypothetical protein